MERAQMFFGHKIFDRNTLIDQTGGRKGVMRRTDNHYISLGCQLPDRLRYLRSLADDKAACIHFYRTKLRLVPVSNDDKIVFIDKILHHIRNGGCDNHLSFYK